MFKDEWLYELFRYDYENGDLYWKEFNEDILTMLNFDKKLYEGYSKIRRNFIDPIRTVGNHGYIFVNVPYYIDGKQCKKCFTVHRVIWFITNGYWPNVVDHLNGDRLDNRLCNLRDVSTTENLYNTKLRRTNKAGKTGVAWSKCKNKWRAYGTVAGKQIHLGYFTSMDDAIDARLKWEVENGIICRG